MFAAGIQFNRALELLGVQSDDPGMRAVAEDVARRVDSGVPLTRAVAAHPQAFSTIQVRMIQVGERTGNLDEILKELAVYEEKRRATTMKVKSALTYPAFLIVISTFMLIVIPPYMFQGLFQMIQTSSTELPLITKVVLAISDFIRTPLFWILLIVLVGGGLLAAPVLLRQPPVRRRLAQTALATPGLGRVYRMIATARFARAMQLQLEVGESPLQAVVLGAQASDNPLLEDGIERSVEALRNGDTLVESLQQAEFFPYGFLHVLKAGEEAGDLPTMMERMAVMYETELETSLETFTSLLEPMVMLVMGIIVGIVVIATMLPMMQLLQNL